MWKLIAWMGTAQLAAAGWLLWSWVGGSVSAAPGAEHKPAVVVELFTSQGCSSCPAADKTMSAMASDPRFDDVYPLSFHVDYWNHIGWKDPFSSNQWSSRQRRYAQVAGTSRVYTPQAIVAGQHDCVGSKRTCLRKAVRKVRNKSMTGQVFIDRARLSNGHVEVALRAHAANPTHSTEVLVAVHTSGLKTEVERGENRGRTLRNDFVVRELKSALTIDAGNSKEHPMTVTLPAHPSWPAETVGVTVFLQDTETLAMLGAARTSIGGPAAVTAKDAKRP